MPKLKVSSVLDHVDTLRFLSVPKRNEAELKYPLQLANRTTSICFGTEQEP